MSIISGWNMIAGRVEFGPSSVASSMKNWSNKAFGTERRGERLRSFSSHDRITFERDNTQKLGFFP
jgi:hypothetical protein